LKIVSRRISNVIAFVDREIIVVPDLYFVLSPQLRGKCRTE